MTSALVRAVCAIGLGLAAVAALAVPSSAQGVTERGFLDATGVVYPQSAASGGSRWIGEALFRQEASWRPAGWLSFAGAFDARAATDDRVARSWSVDWSDRGPQRPALSIRRASVSVTKGGLTVEAGKQFVRWGKADVSNPTDRFAPRDFLEVVDNEFLGVTAVRVTWERGADTIDLVWQPRFTPSRLPLPGGRWAIPMPAAGALAGSLSPSGAAALPAVELPGRLPGRSQAGVRWNHVGAGVEYSLSYFDGFNHLPAFDVAVDPVAAQVAISPIHPVMRMAGGDAAWPLRWFTVKGEIGYFWTPDRRVDDYGMYVVQIERQRGDWLFVGGYSGEFVTANRTPVAAPAFAFDRALARTVLGRASYTIDANRSLALEGALRRNLAGGWLKAEYSQAHGQHWRTTARADLLGGEDADFFGRYRRNSSARLTVRYSY